MATYVTLWTYTGGIEGGGPQRFAKVQEIIAAEGGSMLHVYGLLGSYDVVSVGEFPNTRAAMKASAKVGNLIGAKSQTMPAVPGDDFVQMLAEL